MTAPYFTSTTDGFAPSDQASGPWSPDMMHGRFLGGLAARMLEADLGVDGWRATRLTVDLFRPAAMAPVQVSTRQVRTGRRIRIADALLRCDGHEVGRATAVFLALGAEPPGNIWRPSMAPWPDPNPLPDDPPPDTVDADGDGPTTPNPDSWLTRTVAGGFGTGQQTRIWTNDTAPLVDDEPLSPFVRAAISGDLACPIANSSDDGLHYINADYTLALGRYPAGDWIGLESSQQLAADGVSIASSTLVDLDGPFATSTGCSLATQPLHSA